MLKIWFAKIIFLCLFVACSETKNEASFIAIKLYPINSFVPEYLASIPQIKLPFKSYYKHNFGNYLVNGVVDSVNLKQGYWVIQDVKNNLTYQGTFVNDLHVGWWDVLSGNTLICAGNYTQNRKQGNWSYLQLGQNKNSKYVNYNNDTLSGLAREYTLDSILISSGNFVNGFKNGYWKFYSDIGVLKEQGDYYDNHRSGWWQSFDGNGKLIEEESYSSDEIAGYVTKYVNGIKSEEGKQFNGKKRGVWKFYDSGGKQNRIHEYDE